MQQEPSTNMSSSNTMLIRVEDDSGNGLLLRPTDIFDKKVTQFFNTSSSSVPVPANINSNSSGVQPACSARGLIPCRLHRSVPLVGVSNNNTSVSIIGGDCSNIINNSHQNVNATSSTIRTHNDNAASCVVPVATNSSVHNGQPNADGQIHPAINYTNNFVAQSKLLGEKYLLLNIVEGSSLYRCVNVHNQHEMVCKIVTRDNNSLLSAHYRLDGVPYMNPLHEVLVGERYLYLVFPKSHGDLHSHVRIRRRLREAEARRLFRQMAETVKTCHENGIVLRDLKLRKFVFADLQRSELKLESLEDAVVLENPDDDVLHDKRGCPAYVSPEILRAGAHYSGKAADMWSLGVILYTMLVGRYPFNDSEHASLFAKISRGHFVIPECLSSRAKCLIRSLLRREPSERIASEDVLLHPWLVREDKDTCVSSNSRNTDQLVPDMYVDDDDD